MNQIDLKILKSEQPSVRACAVSMIYGNAHIVLMLEGIGKIHEAIDMLQSASSATTTGMDFGVFGKYPATLSVKEDTICFFIEGEECVDGSSQSVGLYLPRSLASELIDALQKELSL